MRLHAPGQPLRLETLPRPEPARGEVQLRVLACGVCRTDLHVVDGELPDPRLPLVPGHEVVGEIPALGEEFLALAPEVPIRTETRAYPLEAANRALDDLREGRLSGAAVLIP